MEKQSKLRMQVLKFLSQAAAPAVTYKSPPSSPRHPIVSIIPREARRKPRNGSSSFASKEPTSPKVSCMGQVKGKNKKKKKKKKSKPKPKQVCPPPPEESTSLALCVPKEKTLRVSNVIPKLLINQGKTMDDGSVATSSLSSTGRAAERVPSLGQMKRFESRHGVLSDFDLTELRDFSTCGTTLSLCLPLSPATSCLALVVNHPHAPSLARPSSRPSNTNDVRLPRPGSHSRPPMRTRSIHPHTLPAPPSPASPACHSASHARPHVRPLTTVAD
ncbi:hypothetical protein ACLB2K_005615 [Fragaria x ananassa]